MLPKDRSTRWLLVFAAAWIPSNLLLSLFEFELWPAFDLLGVLAWLAVFTLVFPALGFGLVTAFVRRFRPANLGIVALLAGAVGSFVVCGQELPMYGYYWRHVSGWERAIADGARSEQITIASIAGHNLYAFPGVDRPLGSRCVYVHDEGAALVEPGARGWQEPAGRPFVGRIAIDACRHVDEQWLFCCLFD